MGPPSYMRSVVDQNVVKRCIPVIFQLLDKNTKQHSMLPHPPLLRSVAYNIRSCLDALNQFKTVEVRHLLS